jgi:hypothetical protein
MRTVSETNALAGRSTILGDVASCTAAAAHRRDHHHAIGSDCCHPHAVEVIQLGDRGVAVCHDCETDSGFVPRREAERLAEAHQHDTVTVSVRLEAVSAA